MSRFLDSVEACVDRAIEAVGPDLVIGAPLGLGKPVQLLNAFYERVAGDPSLSLHILTALSLEVPRPGSEIEANLAGPIMERLFGDYEELAFLAPFKAGKLPGNVKLSELYFKAGSMKGNPQAQQNYISSNYTHIVRDMAGAGINVMVQMVAARDTADGKVLSLSSNTDLTLEILDRNQVERDSSDGRPIMMLAQVHADMPFMELDAEVSADAFDFIVDNRAYDRRLFAVPNAAVPENDYAIAMHASSLVVDGGTLQIGIGALGDAVAHCCIVRHEQNDTYRELLRALSPGRGDAAGGPGRLDEGLYVSTEMFVNGMMHLVERGIVKRRVYDDLFLQQALNDGAIGETIDQRLFEAALAAGWLPRRLDDVALGKLRYWGVVDELVSVSGDTLDVAGESLANDLDDPQTRAALLARVEGKPLSNGRYLHGGFFLGPADFYDKLRNLDAQARQAICMTAVRRTNQLLLDYPLYSAQRRNARFINTGMMVSLNGCVASDALEDGTVISGVGGQYNFVAMANDLPGARSILCFRSTRGHGKQLQSNIVPHYGYATIPKHLRDIVITEYGIADLRGQSDAEVIKRLINVADSRFQRQLLEYAVKHHKLPKDYDIPAWARNNTPQRIQGALRPYRESGLLPDYPFGTDLTDEELVLASSLRRIKALSEEPGHFIGRAFRALLHRENEEAARPWLERIQLEHPGTPRDFLIQQLLLLDLEERGLLKVG
jgi:hypothetical protein